MTMNFVIAEGLRIYKKVPSKERIKFNVLGMQPAQHLCRAELHTSNSAGTFHCKPGPRCRENNTAS